MEERHRGIDAMGDNGEGSVDAGVSACGVCVHKKAPVRKLWKAGANKGAGSCIGSASQVTSVGRACETDLSQAQDNVDFHSTPIRRLNCIAWSECMGCRTFEASILLEDESGEEVEGGDRRRGGASMEMMVLIWIGLDDAD